MYQSDSSGWKTIDLHIYYNCNFRSLLFARRFKQRTIEKQISSQIYWQWQTESGDLNFVFGRSLVSQLLHFGDLNSDPLFDNYFQRVPL